MPHRWYFQGNHEAELTLGDSFTLQLGEKHGGALVHYSDTGIAATAEHKGDFVQPLTTPPTLHFTLRQCQEAYVKYMQVGTEVFLRPIFDVKEAKRESLLFKQLEKTPLDYC